MVRQKGLDPSFPKGLSITNPLKFFIVLFCLVTLITAVFAVPIFVFAESLAGLVGRGLINLVNSMTLFNLVLAFVVAAIALVQVGIISFLLRNPITPPMEKRVALNHPTSKIKVMEHSNEV